MDLNLLPVLNTAGYSAGYSAVQPVAVMGGSTLKGFVLVIQLGEWLRPFITPKYICAFKPVTYKPAINLL